jgi:hypothetical protein
LQVPFGDDAADLCEPTRVFCQQNGPVLKGTHLCTRGDDFGAEDRVNAGVPGGSIKVYRPVQAVDIRQRQSRTAHRRSRPDEVFDPVRPGEERIVAVAVQVDKHSE